MENQALGRQWIVELEGCPSGPLCYVPGVSKVLLESARLSGAGVVAQRFHQFDPYGVSGVVVLSQSHITAHTWPEYGYAAVDLFFCSDDVDVNAAIHTLEMGFGSRRFRSHSIIRDSQLRSVVAAAD